MSYKLIGSQLHHIGLRRDDLVTIRNCPPVSALKRFKLERILKSPETERELARAQNLQGAAAGTTLRPVELTPTA